MTPKYLTTAELAARWGKTRGTLANLRFLQKGPPSHKIGMAVVYYLADIEAYEKPYNGIVSPHKRLPSRMEATNEPA